MTIKRFGTIRRYAATHQASSILGKRGSRDFPNTVYYSEQYKQAVAAKNKERQKYINANFAQWVMGFPRGWTSPSTTAAVKAARGKTQTNKRFDAISLFSGVGGIELGMHEVFNTILYVEKDAEAQRVLKRRMADGHLTAAKVLDDVANLTEAHVQKAEAIMAGFPCPDIAISGHHAGFSAERSSLFRYVLKAVAMTKKKCGILVLENVMNIISSNMRVVFFEIVAWLYVLGFTHVRWGVLTASDVGSPQKRGRWFLLAAMSDEILEKLKLVARINGREDAAEHGRPSLEQGPPSPDA